MTGLVLALVAGAGAYLIWSSLGPQPAAPRRVTVTRRSGQRFEEWMAQAGLGEVQPVAFVATMVLLGLVGAGAAHAVFGGALSTLTAGLFMATLPVASYRPRRQQRQATARDAWPRLIEEIRISTGSMGRSVPQALLEAGRSAPEPMRPAFAAAAREWRMSTDFGRTVAVLQRVLADPTADAACETLLVAHEVGGSDLDRRLRALAEDRVLDLQGRKDAAAKQAGVRFARRFVIIVPIGMALAGMSIGTGRAAYRTPLGQVAVAAAIALIAMCWVWAGQLMKLPEEDRVFRGPQ